MRASLTRFYGFSEADYWAMSMEQFFEYMELVPKIKDIESGKRKSHRDKVEASLKGYKKRK